MNILYTQSYTHYYSSSNSSGEPTPAKAIKLEQIQYKL